MKAFVWDTETTGLLYSRKLRLENQPHVIEFYGCLVDLKKGKITDEFDTLIKPPSPEAVSPEITRITGITYDRDLVNAPTFDEVAGEIFGRLEKSPCVISHNLSFDMEMIDIEAERLNKKLKWPKRKLCTVEQTTHLQGFRLSMSALHQLLFGEKFKDAHRAKVDVQALVRCCVELYKRGVLA